MARINAVGTGYEAHDLDEVVRALISTSTLAPSPVFPKRASPAAQRTAFRVEADEGTSRLTPQLRTRHVEAIALPKTNSPDHVEWVVSMIERLSPREKRRGGKSPIRIIGMIESAEAMVRIKEIAGSGRGYLDALLVGRSGLL